MKNKYFYKIKKGAGDGGEQDTETGKSKGKSRKNFQQFKNMAKAEIEKLQPSNKKKQKTEATPEPKSKAKGGRN